MKLTKEHFIYYVNALDKMYQEEEEIENALGAYDLKPLFWIDKFADFLGEMCEFPKETRYTQTLLDWFCYEANFGRNEQNNYIEYDLESGNCRVGITNVEDFAKFLEVAEDVEWATTI